jgi:hypothetical protein
MIEILPEVWVDTDLIEGFRYYNPTRTYDALLGTYYGREGFGVRFYLTGDIKTVAHIFPTRSERDYWMTPVHIALETDNAGD